MFVDSGFEWLVAESGYIWSPPSFTASDAAEESITALARLGVRNSDVVTRWGTGARTMLQVQLPPGSDYECRYQLVAKGDGMKPYHPLRADPNLFIRLAEVVPALPERVQDIERSREAILEFANKYGQLGQNGEEWLEWAGVIELSFAVQLWQAKRQDKRAQAAETIRRSLDTQALRDRPAAKAFISGPSQPNADSALRESINWQLRRGKLLRVEVVDAQPIRKLEPVIVPTSLIGAAWSQLLEAVSEEHKFRRCKWCQHGFRIRRRLERDTKLFCSKSCANMASRARQ